MYKKEKEKPWYGKTCEKCDEPINWAYAAKGPIPGWCGKCVAKVRLKFKAELKRELRGEKGDQKFEQVVDPTRRIPKRTTWLTIGWVLGILMALALIALMPDQAANIGRKLRQVAGF